MAISTYIDEATGATVVKVPRSMNGYKYRKHLGIPEHWEGVKKGFRVCAKFRGIKVKNRLAFLRKMSKIVKEELTLPQMKNKRRVFNRDKFKNFPIAMSQVCYCCVKNVAQLRHHVIPLANGGRNKRNNIVPLCKHCHALIHPHLRGPKTMKRLEGVIASRHSVTRQNNGPVVVNPESVIVSDTTKRV